VGCGSCYHGQGAAYVFALVDSAWQEIDCIVAEEPEGDGEFGTSLAFDPDGSADNKNLIITAYHTTSPAGALREAGRVFLYTPGLPACLRRGKKK